ncbi:ATP-binding cassette domain-containing protein [Pedobacter sp. SYSU D00535]|uniref:ATP-binding cassette domain-containing protein n=1 Tax=Pedobacter sp. SYSU D00535 TaxID=2810308 RepID=UPI001A96FBDB|nr:ATP-binding cassette domain-containing protein [Pedobacter sp. SYSU D00535]
MLEIDSVQHSFGNQDVLCGCYLSCSKGEVVGLLGRNGSGKSTLLKIMFGTQRADFMHMKLDGKIVRQGFKNSIAYLPQTTFIPGFIAIEKLLKDINTDYLIPEMTAFLPQVSGKKLQTLSGGELKLMETIWLLSRPADYVLLDEPFSGVAPLHIAIIQKLIKIASKKRGIVLTDHLYRPLLEISDRIVLLHNKSTYQIKSEAELVLYNYLPD